MLRKLILTFIFTSLLSASASLYAASNTTINGHYLKQAHPIQNFKLVTNTGKSFTLDNLKNKWTLVFFGFTNCPMICPATMVALADMYHDLQKSLPVEKLPNVLFVSVDPERDTIKRLNQYVTYFDPSFIGARGADMKETKALIKQLHVAVAKIQIDSQNKDLYVMDHSAEILVFNPEGKLQAVLSYPHRAKTLANNYQTILTQYETKSS